LDVLSKQLHRVPIKSLNEKTITYYINKIARIQEQEESVKRYVLFHILDEKGYEFYQKLIGMN
jgi:hypothetical protein